jgi:ABC-type amino acid transport substrate-binding protein
VVLQGKIDTKTAAEFLYFNKSDAWFTFDVRAKYLFKLLGFDPSKIVVGTPTEMSHLWLVGNKAIDKSVISSFEKAMVQMKSDGTYTSILKKYLEK